MEKQIQTYDSMTFTELIQLQQWLIDLHGKKFRHYEEIPDRFLKEYDRITALVFDIESIILKRVEQVNELYFSNIVE
jgi:hypothetical protein